MRRRTRGDSGKRSRSIVSRSRSARVGEHPRCFGRGETIYNPWHYVPVLAKKPGALRNGAPFKDWPLPASLGIVRRKLKGSDDGDRQMVKILSAVLTDGLATVEAACAEALAGGVHSADVVLNILARRRDPGPVATILTPDALRLRRRPFVDLARGPTHQLGAVAIRQPVRDAERLNPLFVGQQFDCACPVGAPQAAVEAEGGEDAAERVPDVLIGKRIVRQRARAGDFDRHIWVGRERQHFRQIGPGLRGRRVLGNGKSRRARIAEGADHREFFSLSISACAYCPIP